MTPTPAILFDLAWIMRLIRDATAGDIAAGEEIERVEHGSLYGARTVREARRRINTTKENDA